MTGPEKPAGTGAGTMQTVPGMPTLTDSGTATPTLTGPGMPTLTGSGTATPTLAMPSLIGSCRASSKT